MDNTGKIKIFLVMARPVEIKHLHNALVERIEKRKLSHPDDLCAASAAAENCESNGEEADRDGDAVKTDVEAAAAAAEPDHDDSTEPSPKKSLLSTEASSNVQETSDN